MKKFWLLLLAAIFLGLTPSKILAQAPVEPPERIELTPPQDKAQQIYQPIPYIPVMTELNYKSDRSAIFKSGTTLTGMLVFTTSVKPSALIDFYRTQMRLQGWEEMGAFSSKINFLSFRRPEGTAFVIINEGMFNTELRIVVMLQGVI